MTPGPCGCRRNTWDSILHICPICTPWTMPWDPEPDTHFAVPPGKNILFMEMPAEAWMPEHLHAQVPDCVSEPHVVTSGWNNGH